MNSIKVKNICDVIVETHPHHLKLKEKLIQDSKEAEYFPLGDTPAQCLHSSYKTSTPTIKLLHRWMNELIKEMHGIKRPVEFLDTWFLVYKKGHHTPKHAHFPSCLSFVYFVQCPKGSSPLIFSDSGKRIKAEEGKVVIFPSCMYHEVPKCHCDDRITLSGNAFDAQAGFSHY